MGRTRTIDKEAVLDAAERVIARDGAVGLSIDAVATEAGISKSSVVYDYKTKKALIVAVIDRHMKAEKEALETALAENTETPEPEIYGRIAAATQKSGYSEKERLVGLALCAAMASDAAILQRVRDFYDKEISSLAMRTKKPDSALLAFLALAGLQTIEYFGFHTWEEPKRHDILERIKVLATTDLRYSEK